MKSFTYYLYHKPTAKKYYGVRTAEGCNPQDLWTVYFSSSLIVKQLIEEYGKESFDVEVRKVFTNKRDALLWERKVLTRLKASSREDWINRTNGGGAGSHSIETRDKIRSNNAKYWQGKVRKDLSNKFKGHKVSSETRRKISDSLKGNPLSEETKQKMKGRVPWNKGKKGVQIPWNKGLKTQQQRKRLYENFDRTESTSNS